MERGRAMDSSQSLGETTRAASTDLSLGYLSMITDFSSIDSDFGDGAREPRVLTQAARRAIEARRKPLPEKPEVSLTDSSVLIPAVEKEEENIVLHLADKMGRTFKLMAGGGHMSIGRARSCDIVFAFEIVSNKHALLVSTPQHPTDFVLHDLSTNGTYINGEKMLSKQCKLSAGDVLHFGKIKDSTLLQVVRLGPEFSEHQYPREVVISRRASMSSVMLSREVDLLSANLDLESDVHISRLPSTSFTMGSSRSRATSPHFNEGHTDRGGLDDGRRSQLSVANTFVSTASKQSMVYTRLQTVRRELAKLLNNGEEPALQDLDSSLHNSEMSEEEEFIEEEEVVAKEVKKPIYRYGDRVLFKHRVPGVGFTRAQGIVTNIRTIRDEGPVNFFRYVVKSTSLGKQRATNLDEDKILCLVNCKPNTRTKQQAVIEVDNIVAMNRPDAM